MTEVPDKSVFVQYLLKNLKENTNQYLSAEELFSKMRMAVINNSENVPQFGTIQNVGDLGGDFIFIRRKK
jgi:fructose-bisphosphate aldolase class 1